MPLTWKDWLKQTVTAGGTGALTLGAASSGFQAFVAGDNTKLFPYSISDGTAWETGYGTYTSAGTSFARTSRTDSSTGAALNVTTSALLFVDLVSNIVAGMDLSAQSSRPCGRLTLVSAVPVTFTDQLAKTTLYYALWQGSTITLWDGNRWTTVTLTEQSAAVPATTSTPFDVFAYLSAGVPAIETLNWTNATTRATALTTQNGVTVKSGDATRKYLGSGCTTAVNGQCEDSQQYRLLINWENRVPRPLIHGENSGSHTYGTNTTREWAGGSAGTNRVGFILPDISYVVSGLVSVCVGNNGGVAGVRIDVNPSADSTTTTNNNLLAGGFNPGAICEIDGAATTIISIAGGAFVYDNVNGGIGYHYISTNETAISASTSTLYGYTYSGSIDG